MDKPQTCFIQHGKRGSSSHMLIKFFKHRASEKATIHFRRLKRAKPRWKEREFLARGKAHHLEYGDSIHELEWA